MPWPRAEVARQRLAAAGHLQETVQQRLHRIGSLLEAALAEGTVAEATRARRRAQAQWRATPGRTPAGSRSTRPRVDPQGCVPDQRERVVPRLARAITVGVLVVYAAQFLINVGVPFGSYQPGWLTVARGGAGGSRRRRVCSCGTRPPLTRRPTSGLAVDLGCSWRSCAWLSTRRVCFQPRPAHLPGGQWFAADPGLGSLAVVRGGRGRAPGARGGRSRQQRCRRP